MKKISLLILYISCFSILNIGFANASLFEASLAMNNQTSDTFFMGHVKGIYPVYVYPNQTGVEADFTDGATTMTSYIEIHNNQTGELVCKVQMNFLVSDYSDFDVSNLILWYNVKMRDDSGPTNNSVNEVRPFGPSDDPKNISTYNTILISGSGVISPFDRSPHKYICKITRVQGWHQKDDWAWVVPEVTVQNYTSQ